MKNFLTAVLLSMVLWMALPAHAQLVTVDKHYTIKQVDQGHNRLAVKYLNAADEPVKEQLLVDIDGDTQVIGLYGRIIPWTALRPNMEIEVKGGLKVDGHIHAKTITVVKRHV